jgi:hypothetical protein
MECPLKARVVSDVVREGLLSDLDDFKVERAGSGIVGSAPAAGAKAHHPF